MFLVEKSGLGLHNPVMSEEEKYTSLIHAKIDLIVAVKGEQFFQLLITSGWLKGGSVLKKKNGML